MTAEVHDYNDMLHTVKQMAIAHRDFYVRLSAALYAPDHSIHELPQVTSDIGDLIKTIYAHYLVHIPGIMTRIAKLQQTCPDFAEAMVAASNALKAKTGAGLGIQTFLFMPIQRMAGYGALSERLLKLTEKENKDWADRDRAHGYLQECMQACDKICGAYGKVLLIECM